MSKAMFDYIIIGAGPGGADAALALAKQGKRVAIIEKEHWGGTCLFRGCIPTKALLHASKQETNRDLQSIFKKIFEQIDNISTNLQTNLKQAGVTLIEGEAKIIDVTNVRVKETHYQGDHIVYAGGSSPIVPRIEGLSQPGVYTSDDIYKIDKVPKTIAIVGGGYIGFEWANIFANFESQVSLYEALPQVLNAFDDDIRRRLLTLWRSRQIKINTNAMITKIEREESNLLVHIGSDKVPFDAVLIAVGRRPIAIDLPREIQKIGDANGGLLLAHKASAEGRALANNDTIGDIVIPSVVYTDPEIAMVGASENQLKQAGTPYQVFKVPYRANSKAIVTGKDEGYVKLIVNDDREYLLGAAIIGDDASNIIPVLTLAIQEHIAISKLKRLVFPHPTIGEIIGQALETI